jgi:hypothetical protein
MATFHLRKKPSRVGQARKMGGQEQAVLTQRQMADPGATFVRGVQGHRTDPDFRGHCAESVPFEQPGLGGHSADFSRTP